MKNAPPGMAVRDAVDASPVRDVPAVPFSITSVARVSYGSKCFELTVDTPIGTLELDVFSPEGRDSFVQARSVRDKFSGQWRRTIVLDRAFAGRVLEALHEREAPKQRTAKAAPSPHAPNQVLLESERRFDAELERLTAEGGVS